MASKTEICNLALSHLSVEKEISNIDTDRGSEAAVCRRYFEISRDDTMRDFDWPFASKILALALIEEGPNDEWDFSYQYPSDCMRLRRILSGIRNDSRQTRVPYKLASSGTSTIVYTDKEDAEVEYTVKITDSSLFPADFILALSYKLAMYIAPRITGGDPFKLAARAERLYIDQIGKAKDNAVNEQQDEEPVESEFVRSREV